MLLKVDLKMITEKGIWGLGRMRVSPAMDLKMMTKINNHKKEFEDYLKT